MDIKRIIREELKPDNIDYQDIVYEDNNLIVIYPKTKEASCDYGDDTNWCTATDGGLLFMNTMIRAIYIIIYGKLNYLKQKEIMKK